MTISILKAIADKINSLEASLEPIEIFSLSNQMAEIASKHSNLTQDERMGCIAEVSGFRFSPMNGDNLGPWDSYFGPVFSGVKENGQQVHDPDALKVPLEVIEYWKNRAATSPHPLLRARYGDLALEIGLIWNRQNENDSIDLPLTLKHCVIDSYLETVASELSQSTHQTWCLLNRARSLALHIHDEVRAERAKASAFAYARFLRTHSESDYWWMLDNFLKQDNRLSVTQPEKEELINWIEESLTLHSNTNDQQNFDPHDAQSAADRLQYWYSDQKQKHLGISAIKKTGLAFEAAASQAGAQLAIAWLQDLSVRYRHAKLTDEAARVDSVIKARSDEASQEMSTHEFQFEIPREKIDSWLDSIFQGSLDVSLARIAANLITKPDQVEKMVEDSAAQAPLQAHVSIAIGSVGGFKSATIGTVDEDMPGRVVHMASELIGMSSPWLNFAFGHAKEKWNLDSDRLTKWLSLSPIFPLNMHDLLRSGISAWFAEDYVKAIHVLVPQVEAALREWLSILGESPMQANKVGGFEAIGMGQLFHNTVFVGQVHPMLRLHLRSLYTDPRGLNLRNRLAHGLIGVETLNANMANWVIHSLLAIRTFAHLRN